MSVILFMFIIFIVVAVLVAGVVFAVSRSTENSEHISRREKKELDSLRRVVQEIDLLAYENRDVYPELSFLITDKIARSKRNELPPS